MLNPVPATHDCDVVSSKVSECFAGTRQQLLHDIETWRTAGSVPIFILDGIAGIGKSTIVKTVCARADAERSLAASWFFSRDEQDRKSTRGFVRTVAYQLASYHPILRNRISQVLKAQPDILQKAIKVQFGALINEPLRDVFGNHNEMHTISIDAIDECNLTEAVELLSILLTTIPQHPGLRLLVTCRPERPFRLLLQKHQGARVFHLHEIENSVAQADILLYINYRLSSAQIDEALPDLLPPPWSASPEEKEALVQMAGKLFIVASTAINFILDYTSCTRKANGSAAGHQGRSRASEQFYGPPVHTGSSRRRSRARWRLVRRLPSRCRFHRCGCRRSLNPFFGVAARHGAE
ncbi:hypothetical protein BKA70DRAFT_487423 [Coprinopsis sp. MPI-PUGE-AT-0042]|nr:hypothetical protein BKA70DRAFT_487423 [Coprinopsis sp. MPI-PUGE-AT-0042]